VSDSPFEVASLRRLGSEKGRGRQTKTGTSLGSRAGRERGATDRQVPLTRGRSTIYFVGIDDLWLELANLQRALEGVPNNACKIALMHEPDFADIAAQAEIDLQLSGHSHGGQVRLPLIGPLILPKYGEKYAMGFYRIGNFTRLYTTRGIGVLPPGVRFNCPPEITLLTLKAG
jgi:predicted MPP superfamily phosphohydrolase